MSVKKIGQNLGTFERGVRMLSGVGLAAWLLAQPQPAALQWLGLLAASFLVLNGALGRCYLWHLLGLNSANRCDGTCHRSAGHRSAGHRSAGHRDAGHRDAVGH